MTFQTKFLIIIRLKNIFNHYETITLSILLYTVTPLLPIEMTGII